MITEEYLIEREQISNEEIRDLMNEFDVPPVDLAEECDCTYSTFQIYLGDNSTSMPKKHQQTIIHFFLRKFGYEEMNKNGVEGSDREPTASSGEEDSTERNNGVENSTDGEPEPDNEPEGLQHLVPDRIIFKPKHSLAEALIEASDIAEEQRAKVLVRDGQRMISINVEEG